MKIVCRLLSAVCGCYQSDSLVLFILTTNHEQQTTNPPVLTFAELEASTRFLMTKFLTFNTTWVAFQLTSSLQ